VSGLGGGGEVVGAVLHAIHDTRIS